MPIIQVDTNYDRYEIIGGTGFRGFMQYEVTTYRDPQSGKKVEREGITLKFPTGECKETEEILSTIERCIKGLALYNLSRFEIARDLLFNGTEEKKVEKRPNTVQNEEED